MNATSQPLSASNRAILRTRMGWDPTPRPAVIRSSRSPKGSLPCTHSTKGTSTAEKSEGGQTTKGASRAR